MCSVCGFEGISSVGDWSNGMIGVSKTFGGSSILSSPVSEMLAKPLKMEGCELFLFCQFNKVIKKVINNVLIAFFDTLKDTYDTKKVIFI